MYKLINSTNGRIHNFAHKMYWGHNIEQIRGTQKEVKFDGIICIEQEWTVFHFEPIRRGDFIIRRSYDLQKILLYEVIDVTIPHNYGHGDAYEVKVIQCGYWLPETSTKQIVSGYGIKKSIMQRILSKLGLNKVGENE